MSDEVFRQVLDVVGNDETAALEAFAAVAHKFGWAGPIYTRLDVERKWNEMFPGIVFTDLDWEKVRQHPGWRGLHDHLREDCWASIETILKEVKDGSDTT